METIANILCKTFLKNSAVGHYAPKIAKSQILLVEKETEGVS